MLSGDIHMMAYDHGGDASNPLGKFPIFQCAPTDKKMSCQSGAQYSIQPTFDNGQYCLFEFREDNGYCLNFKGFSFDKLNMEFDTCDNFQDAFIQNGKKHNYIKEMN